MTFRNLMAPVAAVVVTLSLAGAAHADPAAAKAAVDAAKAQGVVGEQNDGFLGFVNAGAGLVLGVNGLPVFAQDAPKPDAPLPVGSAGKLTVIHRTEYFEAAQTAFAQFVHDFWLIYKNDVMSRKSQRTAEVGSNCTSAKNKYIQTLGRF